MPITYDDFLQGYDAITGARRADAAPVLAPPEPEAPGESARTYASASGAVQRPAAPPAFGASPDPMLEEVYQARRRRTAQENMEKRGELTRGVLRGIDEMQASLYGMAGLAGSAMGIDRLKDWGIEGYRRNVEEAELNPAAVPSFRDIEGPVSAYKYGAGKVGELLPSVAESVGMALLGGAAGTAVEPGGGTVAGAAAGFLGKTALKKSIEKMAGKMVAEGISREAAERAASRLAMRSLGGASGVVAGTFPLEAGGNYAEALVERGADAPLTAAATGLASSFLELAGGSYRTISKIVGPEKTALFRKALEKADTSLLGSIIKEAGIQAPQEFMQEAGQELLSIANLAVADPTFEAFTGENAARMFEAGMAGAVGGGVFGGIGGAHARIARQRSAAMLQGRIDELAAVPEEQRTDDQQAELAQKQEELQKLYADIDQRPVPSSREEIEAEQQYWDQYGRNFPPESIDREAVSRRQGQLADGMAVQELYERQMERAQRVPDSSNVLSGAPHTESAGPVTTPGSETSDVLQGGAVRREPLQPVAKSAAESAGIFLEDFNRMQSPAGAELLRDRLAGEALRGIQRESYAEPPAPVLPQQAPEAAAIDRKAHEAATSPLNERPEPTEAQKEAGNYKKGRVNFQGLGISIENPQGSVRSGTDKLGNRWESEMRDHYGYILGTRGRDKDHVDAFIGPNPKSERAFIVDQIDPETGKFDEHKVILGASGPEEAEQIYRRNHAPGWRGMGAITEMGMKEFKRWARDPKKTRKPVSYKEGQAYEGQDQGGLGSALGTGQEAGGPVPERGAGGQAVGAGGVFQGQEGGEGLVGAAKEPWQMTRAEHAAVRGFDAANLPSNINELGRDELRKFPIGEVALEHYDSVKNAAESGKPVPAEVLADYPELAAKQAPGASIPYAGPERRKDLAERKRVGQMSPEEMRRELLTNPVTGIPNRRAFEEAEKHPVQASIDVDGLKWVNDNMGHDQGDALLKKVAEELHRSADDTFEAFHVSGDEFVAHGVDEATVRSRIERAREALGNVSIERVAEDGTIKRLKGLGFSYGTGKGLEEAEAGLRAEKAIRESLGLRGRRGGKPKGLVEIPAPGRQAEDTGEREGTVAQTKPTATGEAKTVYTPKGRPIRVRFALEEMENLRTSHDISGNVNERYPRELQPRDRERAASKLQIRQMAGNLNPELLGDSAKVSDGAPIVGPDHVVESGNGRTIAIREAYRTGKADAYRAWLKENAGRFGLKAIDIERMNHPILVRIRETRVDRAEFAREANEADIAVMSPAETAMADAKRISDEHMELLKIPESGNIFASSNHAFVRQFLQKLGTQESAQYLTKDGGYTKQLADRIQAAVFAKAYSDQRLLALMAEEADPDIKNIVNALNMAAPDFARARALSEGLYELDVTPFIVEAANLIRKSKARNQSLAAFLSQQNMFHRAHPNAIEIARYFDANKRSAKRMGEAMQFMAGTIRQEMEKSRNMQLFPAKKITIADIIAAAKRRMEEQYGREEKGARLGLFAGASGTGNRGGEPPGRGRALVDDASGRDETLEEGDEVRETRRQREKLESLGQQRLAFPERKKAGEVRATESRPRGTPSLPEPGPVQSGKIRDLRDFAQVLRHHTSETYLKKPHMWFGIGAPPTLNVDVETITPQGRLSHVPYQYDMDAGPEDLAKIKEWIGSTLTWRSARKFLPPDEAEAFLAEAGTSRDRGGLLAASSFFGATPGETAGPPTPKIEDMGEKIGGARKDTAASRGTRPAAAKPEPEAPSWQRRFVPVESLDRSWAIKDTRTNKLVKEGWKPKTFASRAEAEAAVPLVAVSQKHRVVSTSAAKGEPPQFEIWRKVTDRKRVKVVEQRFGSREEAMRYMATHAEEILAVKTGFGEEILARPEKVVRTGAARREGNVAGGDFMDAFGFRAVEFGNWNNQEERREVMNHAYDALLDLADLLAIPPKALSLNGDLSLAFGARGHGLTGAKAHYERDYGAINLTKMKGAGSLAHEWFHALDHYFARQGGEAKAEKIRNERGDLVYSASTSAGKDMASHGFKYDTKTRKELATAYEALVKTMFKKAETYVEDTQQAEKFVGGARDNLRSVLNDVRRDLETDYTRYKKRGGKPADAEQLASFDVLADRLVNGEDLRTEFRMNQPGNVPARKRGAFSGRHTNDTLEEMSAVLKAVRGRSGFDSEHKGPLDRVRRGMALYAERIKMLEDANKGAEKIKQVPTSFAMEAKKIDQGRATDYWTTPHEMAARAFSAYVEDRIAESGAKSDFLSYGADNRFYLPVRIRPFPEGAERAAIGKAFDDFVKVLQTRETEKGVALFSLLRETRVPVKDSIFKWLKIKPGNVFADYAALHRKHPEQFKSPEEVKVHVERVLDEPSMEMEATKPEYTLLVRRNGEDKAAVVEFRLKGGKYRVKSAYVMDAGQLELKIADLKARGGRVSTNPANPTPLSQQPLTQGAGTPSDVRSRFQISKKNIQQFQGIVNSIARKLPGAPRIEPVRSVEDLPAHVAEEAKKKGGVPEAAYDRETGAVYLVGENIPTPERLQEVLLHELVGHHGVEALLGDRLRPFLKEVFLLYGKKGLQEIADLYGFDLGTQEGRMNAAREKIARIAETGEKPGFLKKLYAAIREALRKLGFTIELSENDIRSLVARAGRAMESGGALGPGAQGKFTPRYSQAAPMFYSQLQRTLLNKLPGSGNPAMFKAMIDSWAKKGEFKAEELEWSGLREWLAERKGKIGKQEILNFLRENEVRIEEVEHSSLSTLSPEEESKLKALQFLNDIGGLEGQNEQEYLRLRAKRDRVESTKYDRYTRPGGNYYRELLLTLPDRTSLGTKEIQAQLYMMRSLHMEFSEEYRQLVRELQEEPSPPYRSTHWDESNVLAHVRFDDRAGPNGERLLHIAEVQSDWHQEGRRKGYADVPNAPFKTTWPMLAMKRMIRYAAENGYDGISWDPGNVQAERYDLSKQIDVVYAGQDTMEPGTYNVSLEKDGDIVHSEEAMSPEALADFIGKELAQKIVDQAVAPGKEVEFRGLDLKAGGEGMKGFYDKILPSEVNKYVKKWGAKVAETSITTEGADTVHYLPVTGAMRDAAMKGQPLFSMMTPEGEFKTSFSLKDAARTELLSTTKAAVDRVKGRTETGFLGRLFITAEHWKHKVGKAIFDAAQGREEDRHQIMNVILKAPEVADAFKKIMFEGKDWWTRQKGYDLYDQSDAPKPYRDAAHHIDAMDRMNWKWTVHKDADGNPVYQKDANGKIIEPYRDKLLRERKVSRETIAVIDKAREMLDAALDLQRADIRELLDHYEKAGKPVPVIGTQRDAEGRPRQVTLKDLYNQMGFLKGSYSPRIREAGDWFITSQKGGERYRFHQPSRRAAYKFIERLKREGHKNIGEPQRIERLPESVYQDISIPDIQAAVDRAVRGADLDPEIAARLRKEVLESAADILKERGFRAHKIQRSEGDVVRGYITDPLTRNLMYAQQTAGGIAKSKAASKMFKALMGEYRTYEREGDEWVLRDDAGDVTNAIPLTAKELESERQTKSVHEGGIIPEKEPERFDTYSEYIREMLRNPDATDRFIAFGKSVVSFKYLGLSPRTVLANVTALATTVPPALHEYAMGGKGSLLKVGKELTGATRDFARVMTGKQLENADERAFMDQVKGSANLEQFTREAMADLAGAYGRSWQVVMDKAMWMFRKSEEWIRGSTMLAGYRLARERGLSHEDAVDAAMNASNKAHGIYGKATMPIWAMGSNPAAKIGQMGYTYAKFAHNYLQTLHDLGANKRNVKAFIFALLSPAVLAGSSAMVAAPILLEIGKAMMRAVGDDRDPEKMVYDVIRENLGGEAERFARFGLLGAAGIDLSGSLAVGMQTPRTLLDLTGAFGGVVEDIGRAGHYLATGQPGRAAERAAPVVMGNFLRAMRELNGATTSDGNRVWDEEGKPYIPTGGETAGRVLGFKSGRRATVEARERESRREQAKFSDRRKNIYEEYRAYLSDPERDPEMLRDVLDKVERYNAFLLEHGMRRIVPLISRDSMRDQVRKMLRPSGRRMEIIESYREEAQGE
ncbi:MAG TPA: PLxRFG domain-containing protein [Syntrophobacter fumaroxidans]|nr:PLxRFG domain-containing protein [Syntrophobacter fumaroxidans]